MWIGRGELSCSWYMKFQKCAQGETCLNIHLGMVYTDVKYLPGMVKLLSPALCL